MAYRPDPGESPPVISDDPGEVFDLVDERDRVIGQVRRGDAHADRALIHRSVQVLVFDRRGRLLLQRRSQTKDLFPGYYCASASGHVTSGEDYEQTAQREVQEELGVALPLTCIGKTLVRSLVESEITTVFTARSDGPFRFHPTETVGGKFFMRDALARARGRAVSVDELALTPAVLAALDMLDQTDAWPTEQIAPSAISGVADQARHL